MTAYQFRQLIEEKGKLVACQKISPAIKNPKQADALIFAYFSRLLSKGEYTGAAILIWGINTFDPRPITVRAIWKQIENHSKCLVMAAGSIGKSYSAMAWVLLDWLRDPEFTSVKIISTTASHTSTNTFSTLVRLWRQSIIQLPGMITSDYIGLDSKEKKSGISIVAIPQGEDGRGRLKGFHPDPRPKPHPILGPSARIRVVMDECEEIPVGVWEGIANVLLTSSDPRSVKVLGLFNPKNPASLTARAAEPPDGWDSLDSETGVRGKNTWVSKNKWSVLRIDAKHTENVKHRRVIYPGLIDYVGYRDLELKDGGNSVDYWSQARGIFPPEGATGVLISQKLLNEVRGEFVFSGNPIRAAGVDIALDGRDNCVLTVGRVGKATGFHPKIGRPVKFKEPRSVLQVDQQFILPKGDTKKVGDSIIANCIKLGVAPEYCCVDATGQGSGVYSYVRAQWGDDVQGINFSANASEVKILEEDQYNPLELYEKVVSEVWFALQKWMEFGMCALSPGLRRDPLDSQLSSRKYVLGVGKKLRVETKDDFKKRMAGRSPDEADSLTILLHGVRNRDSIMGTMVDEEKPEAQSFTPQHDQTAEVSWMEDAGV